MSELPRWSGDAPECAKCGHRDIDTQYAPCFNTCSGMTHGQYLAHAFGGNEAMVRDCTFCGFTWAEQLPTEGQKRLMKS